MLYIIMKKKTRNNKFSIINVRIKTYIFLPMQISGQKNRSPYGFHLKYIYILTYIYLVLSGAWNILRCSGIGLTDQNKQYKLCEGDKNREKVIQTFLVIGTSLTVTVFTFSLFYCHFLALKIVVVTFLLFLCLSVFQFVHTVDLCVYFLFICFAISPFVIYPCFVRNV